MAEKAIILIPDISGFTDFTTATELDHSAHIITELLELIVDANESGFTLAEIEGDAVLFYRTGEPLSRQALIDQCLSMFTKFHSQLMLIERDTVCQCGACQSATNLTLKFIVHYGDIKEINIARFVKATGVDMIVAHRLLKNDVDSNEYILITQPCATAIGQRTDKDRFKWLDSSQNYPGIGTVNFEYATLSEFCDDIPHPPERERHVRLIGESEVGIDISAPLLTVYQIIIDVDKRIQWMAGVLKIDREQTSERIGMRHNCTFMGVKMNNTAIYAEYTQDYAMYAEEDEMPDMGIKPVSYYEMRTQQQGITELKFIVNWQGAEIPPEVKQGIMDAVMVNLELLKEYCEGQS